MKWYSKVKQQDAPIETLKFKISIELGHAREAGEVILSLWFLLCVFVCVSVCYKFTP